MTTNDETVAQVPIADGREVRLRILPGRYRLVAIHVVQTDGYERYAGKATAEQLRLLVHALKATIAEAEQPAAVAATGAP